MTSFLASIRDLDERRRLTAHIYSGRRRPELLRLDWEGVALDREECFIGRSKSHLARWYSIHPMFKAVLESIACNKTSGRIFFRWSHPDTITHIAKKALRNAGYPEMSLHKMRHTFATLLVEAGVDLNTIGALLGHTNKRATEIYAQVTDTRQRVAIRMIKAGPVDLLGGSNDN